MIRNCPTCDIGMVNQGNVMLFFDGKLTSVLPPIMGFEGEEEILVRTISR